MFESVVAQGPLTVPIQPGCESGIHVAFPGVKQLGRSIRKLDGGWADVGLESRCHRGVSRERGEGQGLRAAAAPAPHAHRIQDGIRRTNPLASFRDGDRYVVVASKGGAPTNPDWYRNLLANPRASIENGKEELPVTAVPAGPGERSRLWAMITKMNPAFADYQRKTTRTIPVVILTPDV